MESLKVGITGAGGYIGSRVSKLVIEQGHEVVLIDNSYNSQVSSINRKDIIEQDVRDIERLREVFDEVDIILHLAAITGIPECEENEELAYEVNARGTENIVRVCKENEIPLVFPMSMQVFGETEEFPINEGSTRRPVNNYGATKAISEKTIEILSRDSFPAHVFIKSNVYGKHKVGENVVDKGTVVNYFVECAKEEEDLTVHRPGTQARDFIHVKDVARAYIRSIEAIFSHENGKKSFILASGESTSIEELANVVSKKTEKVHDSRPDVRIVKNPREKDSVIENFNVDNSKIRKKLDFEIKHNLEDSVREMLTRNA